MKRQRPAKSAGDLVEEAVHVLRAAPAATLAVYYLGAVPFVLGGLYFWADMSSSPFAGGHLSGSALGVAALFLWLKFCQADFARRVRAQLAAAPPPRWTPRRAGRVLLAQTIVQPSGLFLIPLSAIFIFPFPWVYAFYQNVTALGADDDRGPSRLWKQSLAHTRLWPRQNVLVLGVLGVFGFYVFLNWTTVCLTLPYLVKTLLGIRSVFTRSLLSLLNPTFFAGMFGLTYLCVDPILKVIYALRCFHGDSLQSGEDLKAELTRLVASAAPAWVALALALNFFAAPARAADAVPPGRAPVRAAAAPAGVSASELNRAISQTIRERKFTWRMPRQNSAGPDANPGVVAQFFHRLGQLLRRWVNAVATWLSRWLERLFRRRPAPAGEDSGYGWMTPLDLLLYGLIAAAAAALAVLLYRVGRNRRRPARAASQAIQPAPDPGDETVGADQLPEDGWLALARECLERGELRLALRAFYLASLSHLAARNLIRLARAKSNRDYERELRRRAHASPELLAVFGDNLPVFERIWYGSHDVNRELVDRFAANVERMRRAA